MKENIDRMEAKGDSKRRLLLHSCCGPCSTSVIERLSKEYDVTVLFFNPNITDEDEYKIRKEAQKQVLKHLDGIKLLDEEYEPKRFFEAVKGYEDAKEGQGRCSLCFKLRLEETAKIAKSEGFDIFATTLTVSPHKNYRVISSIGNKIADEYKIEYYDGNFKKQDGYKRSIDLSKEMNIYRQNYCGCEFSKWFK